MEEIEAIGFKDEHEMHRLVEDHFENFFPNLKLVKSEFDLGGRIIDSLAFNIKAKAFVIIEYKMPRNRDVFDQIHIYHQKLQDNKDACVLRLNNTMGTFWETNQIDWKKPRMIIVSSSFTPKQIEASNSKLLIIDLYVIRKYPNHLTASTVGVADNEPPTRLPWTRSGRDKKPLSSTSFDTSIIFSVFEDGKMHTLSEIYTVVEELCAQRKNRHASHSATSSGTVKSTLC